LVLGGRENVYSAEVESAIDEHPDVYEVAADGVPHERLGEEVAATVCVRDGRSLDAVQLGEFLDAHLAPFKIPSHWRSVDAPLLRNSPARCSRPHSDPKPGPPRTARDRAVPQAPLTR
jgi:long-chain acyl-CoA synthetase